MKSRPWIIAHDAMQGADAYAMECLRCGDKQRFACPIDLDIYLAASKVFQKQHAHCNPVSVPCPESETVTA